VFVNGLLSFLTDPIECGESVQSFATVFAFFNAHAVDLYSLGADFDGDVSNDASHGVSATRWALNFAVEFTHEILLFDETKI